VLAWGLGGLLLLYYLLPLGALLLAQPPGEVLRAASRPAVLRAAAVSLASAGTAVAVSLLLGVPLAYGLARARRKGRNGWRRAGMILAALPLVFPPVVSGMLLLTLFGVGSPVGAFFAENGLPLTRSFAAVVGAQVFVASPFVVLTAQAALESVPPAYAQAARTLGSGRWRTFRRVTLPLARRGLLAGATLCFARAVGEFGATLMVAYYPRTLPVEVWVAFTTGGIERAFPVAALLAVLALLALLALNTLGSIPWTR
jgi:molybdate/tungstate transport system permease protein